MLRRPWLNTSARVERPRRSPRPPLRPTSAANAPASGFARVRGGLSAADFVKVISVQELTRQSLLKLAPAITTLARAEGLEAHARSVEVRTRG